MSTPRIIGGPSEHSTPPRSNPSQPQTPILKPPKPQPVQPRQRRMLKLKDAAHYVLQSWRSKLQAGNQDRDRGERRRRQGERLVGCVQK
jgi:hypothetical protein